MPVKGKSLPILERIRSKFVINFTSGCWEWARSRSSQGRYPTIAREGTGEAEYVHKIMWESVNGPIPIGPCPDGSDRWELHHRCLNEGCVNPAHIELLTRRQHIAAHQAIRAAIKLAQAA